jgi:hypothetical protein
VAHFAQNYPGVGFFFSGRCTHLGFDRGYVIRNDRISGRDLLQIHPSSRADKETKLPAGPRTTTSRVFVSTAMTSPSTSATMPKRGGKTLQCDQSEKFSK